MSRYGIGSEPGGDPARGTEALDGALLGFGRRPRRIGFGRVPQMRLYFLRHAARQRRIEVELTAQAGQIGLYHAGHAWPPLNIVSTAFENVPHALRRSASDAVPLFVSE